MLEKRQRVLDHHKSSDLYVMYKHLKQDVTTLPCLHKVVFSLESDDLPETPRPEMHSSKQNGEVQCTLGEQP